MPDYRLLKVQKEGRVGWIGLQRPPVNSIDGALLTELRTAFREWKDDDNIGAVVVTGAIRNAFCTGGDLSELFAQRMADFGYETKLSFFHEFQEIYCEIEQFPKPTVAAINGLAIGAGIELALVCDLRISSDVAYFSLPELTHGIIPNLGATQRLHLFIGATRAKEMMFSGKRIRAVTALEWGLVNEVVPAKALQTRALELASELAKLPAAAVAALKRCISSAYGSGVTREGLRKETEIFTALLHSKLNNGGARTKE